MEVLARESTEPARSIASREETTTTALNDGGQPRQIYQQKSEPDTQNRKEEIERKSGVIETIKKSQDERRVVHEYVGGGGS